MFVAYLSATQLVTLIVADPLSLAPAVLFAAQEKAVLAIPMMKQNVQRSQHCGHRSLTKL